ncbi:glycerophosphodiester phosphodiesterase [Leifsonia kafniensis]|uniref:glycerophosphodiester phosphodiesterase n=1 Tax=Leifsonia kafniensis TaxID=475957 RepID=UPI0031E83BE8
MTRATAGEAAGARFGSAASARLDRRTFLLLGGSALLLTACQSVSPQPPPPVPVKTTAAPAPALHDWTIDDLLATQPFYVAHRGSGDNWMEHTIDAYSRAIALGAGAIEVSVNCTADGVLVCHHDATTKRMTVSDLTIADVTYAELSQLRNDSRAWLGPAAALQPIPRLTDVLDAFAATHVIFIEDKQGTNTQALLDVMNGYPDPTAHFVWKQWAGAKQHALAAQNGYRTWGYFTEDLYARVDELAPEFDFLGVFHTESDAHIAQVVASGKPVIAWEIHFRSMRERMKGLGVAGMMCSNLPYLTAVSAAARTDSFASGLRAPGDLPWTTEQGWSVQPVLDPAPATVELNHRDIQSYLMGSMSPIAVDAYRITAELCWPDAVPDPTQHAGLAFGLADDRAYRVRVAGESAGYHVVIRANGSVELFRRSAQAVDGTLLGQVQTAPVAPGTWVRLDVEVNGNVIRILRLDGDGWSFEVKDSTYRGGYFWLCKNYVGGPGVQFRSIVVS